MLAADKILTRSGGATPARVRSGDVAGRKFRANLRVRSNSVPRLTANATNWSAADFTREVERVKGIGPGKLTNDQVFGFCRGAHTYFRGHYWADARPVFVELWRRIERHRIPGIRTKTQACQVIGCSLGWAEMIVSGRAEHSNANKSAKSLKNSTGAVEAWGDEAYVDDIARYANRKLQSVMARDWPRFQEICGLLEQHFADSSARRNA